MGAVDLPKSHAPRSMLLVERRRATPTYQAFGRVATAGLSDGEIGVAGVIC